MLDDSVFTACFSLCVGLTLTVKALSEDACRPSWPTDR